LNKKHLYYYNGKGLGEISRYLFTLANQPFEDLRYVDPEDNQPNFPLFDDLKASGKLPFGQVPILEVTIDGHTTTIAQSNAIQRYIARTFGFLGSTSEENALIDSLVEELIDIRREYSPITRIQNKEEAAQQFDSFYNNTIPKHLGYISRFVKEGQLYLVGNKISLADVAFFYLLEILNNQDVVRNTLNNYPVFVTWRERVHSALAHYIANRPPSEY